MRLFGGGGKQLTGLDIGASAVKIISGVRKKRVFMVDRLVIIPLPPRSIDERGIANMEAVTEAVRLGMQEIGVKKPLIATALRGGSVITKRVTIPKIPMKEIPDQVKWEAEQVFPQDITTILVDHVVLGEGGNVPGAPPETPGWDLMLVGVREEEATAFHDIVEAAEGELRYVDLDAFVATDFFSEMVDLPKDDAIAFVDIGAAATRVAVRFKGTVTFIREFPVGGNAFTDAIASSLGLNFENAEALKTQEDSGIPQEAVEALQAVLMAWRNELQQCEDIFVTQGSATLISAWYIYGGGARTPGLLDVLRDERFVNRVQFMPVHEYFQAKGKNVDTALLQSWALRLVTAAGLGCRKG